MSQDDLDLMFKGPQDQQSDESADSFIDGLMATATEDAPIQQIGAGYVQVPAEQMTPSQIQGKLLEATTDAIEKSAEALNSVLSDLQSSPGDMQTMMGASHLITAHAHLIAQLNKVNELNAKLIHNEKMVRLKTSTQKEISSDQIESKERIMLGREAWIAAAEDEDDEEG